MSDLRPRGNAPLAAHLRQPRRLRWPNLSPARPVRGHAVQDLWPDWTDQAVELTGLHVELTELGWEALDEHGHPVQKGGDS